MKKAIGCSAQLILLLVAVSVLATPMACIATATAPLHTPKLAESFVCPPHTRLVTEWYQATWNRPGEKTLAVYCVDEQGNELSTLPQDEKMFAKGIPVYFPYAFIPLLALGAIVLLVLNIMGMTISAFLKKTISRTSKA